MRTAGGADLATIMVAQMDTGTKDYDKVDEILSVVHHVQEQLEELVAGQHRMKDEVVAAASSVGRTRLQVPIMPMARGTSALRNNGNLSSNASSFTPAPSHLSGMDRFGSPNVSLVKEGPLLSHASSGMVAASSAMGQSRRPSMRSSGSLRSQQDVHSSVSSIGEDVYVSGLQSAGGELGAGWPMEIRLRKEFSARPSSGHHWGSLVARLSTNSSTAFGSEDSESDGENSLSVDAHPSGQGRRNSLGTGFKIEGTSTMKSSDLRHEHDGVWDPDSRKVMLFDLLIVLVLLQDLYLTPYALVTNISLDRTLQGLAVFSAACWTVDFLLGFRIGLYVDGELLMHPTFIRRRYLRGWCIPNFIVLLMDYASIVLSFTDHTAFTRLLRMARLVKMLRLFRLMHITERVIEACNFGRLVWTLIKVVTALCAILLYNHFISCAWLWIGAQSHSNTGRRWIDVEEEKFGILSSGQTFQDGSLSDAEDDLSFFEAHKKHFYITAMHWALAQMTPGPIDIASQNLSEKLFNLIVLLSGVFVTSFIVSTMSGHVMEVIMSQRKMREQLERMEDFLRQNAVRPKLAVRIKRQVRARMRASRLIREEEVGALHLLSAAMRSKLILGIRRPLLLEHPLMKLVGKVDGRMINRVCEEAVSFIYLESEDELFEPLTMAVGAYGVVSGAFSYIQSPQSSKETLVTAKQVPGKDGEYKWFSEPSLWSHWLHVGRMECIAAAQVLCVNGDQWASCVQRHASDRSGLSALLQQYARNYHMRLTTAVPPQAPWPSDLDVPCTDPGDLLSHHVGLGLLKWAVSSGNLQLEKDALAALRDELKAEKCTLQIDKMGELHRLVALMTLRLHQEDGSVLVQVASIEAAEAWSSRQCGMLPGSKRAMGELPADCFKRVLEGQLEPLAKYVSIQRVDHERLTEDSPRYGMKSIYLKTVHEAVLSNLAPSLPKFEASNLGPPPAPFTADRLHIHRGHKDRILLLAWIGTHEVEVAGQQHTKDAVASWLSDLPAREVCGSDHEEDREDVSDLDASSTASSRHRSSPLEAESGEVSFT
mmetsp:Transcript_21668/g.50657  ORF Transcript_21668/g.50657 Transcript_21668/m.50657 type:complete len:1048 (-) Transcript_21668:163-3306(-)